MTMPAELDGDQHLDDGPLLETRNQLNLTEERQTSHMPVSHHIAAVRPKLAAAAALFETLLLLRDGQILMM